MRRTCALLGTAEGNRYPGFSASSLAEFGDLPYDLQSFAGTFLNGELEHLTRHVAVAPKAEENAEIRETTLT
jgi:hypothetical protein